MIHITTYTEYDASRFLYFCMNALAMGKQWRVDRFHVSNKYTAQRDTFVQSFHEAFLAYLECQ